MTTRLKPGLHIVVIIAEYACDHAAKRILKLSTHRLQVFLVKDQYLWSLQRYGEQTKSEGRKKTCSQTCPCDPYDIYENQALR